MSFYASFFWQRNAAMTARLVELARDGQTRFVVLGAGHMLGAKGIPALLAQRGFVVERVIPGAAARLPDAAERRRADPRPRLAHAREEALEQLAAPGGHAGADQRVGLVVARAALPSNAR